MNADFKYEFGGVQTESGTVIRGRKFFDRTMSAVAIGTPLKITVEPQKDKRTNKQNRAMWGTIYDQLIDGIAKEVGYDRHERAEAKELIHEGLCAKYQGYETCKVTGQQVRKFRTSKANKQEFSDYVEWVARFAAQEYGVVIVLPGETD
jgi:hypothetical protein